MSEAVHLVGVHSGERWREARPAVQIEDLYLKSVIFMYRGRKVLWVVPPSRRLVFEQHLRGLCLSESREDLAYIHRKRLFFVPTDTERLQLGIEQRVLSAG